MTRKVKPPNDGEMEILRDEIEHMGKRILCDMIDGHPAVYDETRIASLRGNHEYVLRLSIVRRRIEVRDAKRKA